MRKYQNRVLLSTFITLVINEGWADDVTTGLVFRNLISFAVMRLVKFPMSPQALWDLLPNCETGSPKQNRDNVQMIKRGIPSHNSSRLQLKVSSTLFWFYFRILSIWHDEVQIFEKIYIFLINLIFLNLSKHQRTSI